MLFVSFNEAALIEACGLLMQAVHMSGCEQRLRPFLDAFLMVKELVSFMKELIEIIDS